MLVLPTTTSSTLPSHRQRRINTNTPSSNNDRSHTNPPPGAGRPRRRRKQQRGTSCCFIPSERVLRSLGWVLGILLLVAISILVHLIFLLVMRSKSSKRQPFSNIQFLPELFSFPKATTPMSNGNSSNKELWNPELKFLHKVHRRRRRSSSSSSANATTTTTTNHPIFVVGLPKAGTSSLFAYFDCLGFYSQHWYCCGPQHHAQQEDMAAYVSDCMVSNLQDGLPILDGCGDYEVYTELNGPRKKTKADQNFVGADGMIGYRPRIFLPQRYHLKELHEYAPNATWILNVRPLEDWVHSVSQVPAKMLTKQLLYEAQFQDPERWAQPTLWNRHPYRPTVAFLEEFWKDHIQYVTQFVAAHPSHSLIWVNITNPNAGIQLAQDLVAAAGGGSTINFPPSILQEDRGRKQQGSLQTSSLTENGHSRLYSRAKACWGAHNVKQHGGR